VRVDLIFLFGWVNPKMRAVTPQEILGWFKGVSWAGGKCVNSTKLNVLTSSSMTYEQHPTTEEINLVRLLRRLEKTVANKEEWTAGDVVPAEIVILRARKTVQVGSFEL